LIEVNRGEAEDQRTINALQRPESPLALRRQNAESDPPRPAGTEVNVSSAFR
jgi:hypothetical protein